MISLKKCSNFKNVSTCTQLTIFYQQKMRACGHEGLYPLILITDLVCHEKYLDKLYKRTNQVHSFRSHFLYTNLFPPGNRRLFQINTLNGLKFYTFKAICDNNFEKLIKTSPCISICSAHNLTHDMLHISFTFSLLLCATQV